jgi:hypothetical protein
MKNNNNISENPLENASFLSRIEKKNSFSTPENYFKEKINIDTSKHLENNILINIFDKLSYRFLVPFMSIATVIILILNYNNPTPSEPLTSDQISEVLINRNYIDLDEDLLIETYAEMLENETFSEENNENENEEYINYLIENDIDINTIINEL